MLYLYRHQIQHQLYLPQHLGYTISVVTPMYANIQVKLFKGRERFIWARSCRDFAVYPLGSHDSGPLHHDGESIAK